MTTETRQEKWTEGPWHVNKMLFDDEPIVHIVADKDGGMGLRPIGEVFIDTRSEYIAEDEANANLIAAAPELYEALAFLRDCHLYHADFAGAPEFEKARAALAKAVQA